LGLTATEFTVERTAREWAAFFEELAA